MQGALVAAWGNLMTKQMPTTGFAGLFACALAVALLLPVGMQTAEAKQCSATMPAKPQGHWTYRLIDGRKCWYEGSSKISKSLLQWPAQAKVLSRSVQAEPASTRKLSSAMTQTVNANTEKSANQSRPETPLNDSVSFEARWRDVEITLLRN